MMTDPIEKLSELIKNFNDMATWEAYATLKLKEQPSHPYRVVDYLQAAEARKEAAEKMNEYARNL